MDVTQKRVDPSTVEVKLFIDGQQRGATTGDFENANISKQFRIGARLGADRFGDLAFADYIRFYNRALSASEINRIYDNNQP